MCTVSFSPQATGYHLAMNRDEKLSRVAGVPPVRHVLDGRTLVYPSEPAGGTWISVNDACVSFALINWYSVAARVPDRAISRGEVVKGLATVISSGAAEDALVKMPLARMNPFRLIGVFPGQPVVTEWRWNRTNWRRIEHPWEMNIWISSGFDEPGAQTTRRAAFDAARNSAAAGSLEWLRRLHASHVPGRGAYSICMHRDDAATVSYTEISVADRSATMRYSAGAPCCQATGATVVAAAHRRLSVSREVPSLQNRTGDGVCL